MSARRDTPRPRARTPGFFWQGVLILLPTALLAAAGIWALRRDYMQTRAEARERAQTLADAAANHLWTELNGRSRLDSAGSRWLGFRIDGQGSLLSPAPVPPLEPAPPPVDDLPESLRGEWERAVELSLQSNPQPAVAAWQALLTNELSALTRALAQFQLGQSLDAAGLKTEATAAFHEAATRPEARLESGLPLRMIAAWREFETSPGNIAALEMACAAAVQQPNLATSEFFRRAAKLSDPAAAGIVRRWAEQWARDETCRFLWRASMPYRRACLSVRTNERASPQSLRALWPDVRTFWDELREARVAAGVPTGQALVYTAKPHATPLLWSTSPPEFGDTFGGSYAAYFVWMGPASEADADMEHTRNAQTPSNALGIWPLPLHSLLKAANLEPPKGWSLVVSFAGMEFGEGVWGGIVGFNGAELMAIGTPTNCRDDSLRIKLFLANPVAYFTRQRQRLWGFTALLIAAAGASVAGFFSARRAFLRARQLSEMKSNFVSSVSHELRAPLASVRLMAENLDRGKIADEAKQREYFRFIVQECRRLGSLVENVLDFARIEQGRKEYDFEPTDIGALVAQTVNLMKPAAGEKQVTLLIDAARRSAELPLDAGRADLPVGQDAPQRVPTESRVSRQSLPLGENPGADNEQRAELELGAPLLDASAIQQALINLLDNAIKHSPAGATVVIGLTPPSRPAASGNSHASRFTLYVQDSGPGIPPEEHEKIFQRFYRRGPELRRETQGVGIGLSIVKHIAEAHGGRVVVESQVGKGSRFAIELPCAQTHGVQSSKFKVQSSK